MAKHDADIEKILNSIRPALYNQQLKIIKMADNKKSELDECEQRWLH